MREALLPLINPAVRTKYGIELPSFIVENISLPPEVEQAIDKRSSMAAVGNLNDYVKFQMGQGMEKGGSGSAPAEMAMGFAMAQQMMREGFGGGTPTPEAAATLPTAPEMLTPADVAQLLN